MRLLVVSVASFLFACDAREAKQPSPSAEVSASSPLLPGEIEVEASCGECQFGMKGDDCDLAVRIDGKTYFVDGTTMDEHGDAHAKDGFCNAVRKARDKPLVSFPDTLAVGDAIKHVRERMQTEIGMCEKYTFSGAGYFKRMKERELYTTDNAAIAARVAKAGLSGALGSAVA